MSDLLHTHMTVGVVDGCPACLQLAHDMAVSARDAMALVAVGD